MKDHVCVDRERVQDSRRREESLELMKQNTHVGASSRLGLSVVNTGLSL